MYTAWLTRVGELKKNAVYVPLRPQAHSCCLAACQTWRQKQEDFCKISSNNWGSLLQHDHRHYHLLLKHLWSGSSVLSAPLTIPGETAFALSTLPLPCASLGRPRWFEFHKFLPLHTRVPGHLLCPLRLLSRVKESWDHILPTQHPVVLTHKVRVSLRKSRRAVGHALKCRYGWALKNLPYGPGPR